MLVRHMHMYKRQLEPPRANDSRDIQTTDSEDRTCSRAAGQSAISLHREHPIHSGMTPWLTLIGGGKPDRRVCSWLGFRQTANISDKGRSSLFFQYSSKSACWPASAAVRGSSAASSWVRSPGSSTYCSRSPSTKLLPGSRCCMSPQPTILFC